MYSAQVKIIWLTTEMQARRVEEANAVPLSLCTSVASRVVVVVAVPVAIASLRVAVRSVRVFATCRRQSPLTNWTKRQAKRDRERGREKNTEAQLVH